MPHKTDNPSVQIVVRGLVKRYHYQPVLDRLSLTVEDGAFCILVGANGSGKTTLLRILASLVKPNQGEIHIGQPLAMQNPELRRLIGYVGHQPMFYNDLTAVENLRHYTRLYQCPQPEARIEEAIRTAGLTAHQHKPVRSFSRGMQQRLSIARALLHDPRILLFDEPYTGLDQEAAHHLDQQLQRLHHPGCLILLAAHRPGRLINIASHIAWLQNGRISHHIPVECLPEMPELQAYLQEGA
jgi:heme exporter protein A